MKPAHWILGAVLATFLTGIADAEQACELNEVTFEEGTEGWIGTSGSTGSTELEESGGNPGHHLHTVFNDFGITFLNTSNPTYIQDLSAHDQVTIEVNLKVEAIDFFGTPATRPWLVEIRDYDGVPPGQAWVSVWYLFEWVGAGDWRTFEVTISDPSSSELPPGWGGSGAEDPVTYEPMLPANRTFADVLAGADAIAFTTFLPGWAFGFTDFDVRFDNVRFSACSTPECPGDLNADGRVDGEDLTRLLAAWGACAGDCSEDLGGNGVVDGPDLGILLGYWGSCPG
ncbi:MAG: hypothetical protein CBC35_11580 [Planctomycetes bacterium TMED75]|nr:hypothetical protein [Planctomycetaceae bacterium]OUU90600.1 MAG: hypothetical protein CBC35_11580 [Planctomycetes bacterium TMED75]